MRLLPKIEGRASSMQMPRCLAVVLSLETPIKCLSSQCKRKCVLSTSQAPLTHTLSSPFTAPFPAWADEAPTTGLCRPLSRPLSLENGLFSAFSASPPLIFETRLLSLFSALSRSLSFLFFSSCSSPVLRTSCVFFSFLFPINAAATIEHADIQT